MTYFKIFLFILINCIVTYAKISDKRLCADPNCSVPISLAKTLLRYARIDDDRRILNFPQNVPIKIFSKAAGSRLDLWGAEINGKRGYVPISHVRETKILKTDPNFLVSTDDNAVKNSAPAISSGEVPKQENILQPTKSEEAVPVTDQISPNSVSSPYEVIDGTTIYIPSPNGEVSTPPNEIPGENIAEPTLSVTPNPKAVLNNLNSNVETVEVKENGENALKQLDERQDSQQPLPEEKAGMLDSISKFFSNAENDGTATDDVEEDYADDEEGVEDEKDDEAEEEEGNEKEQEKNTDATASVVDKVNDEEVKVIEQINSDIANVNSELNLKENAKNITGPPSESGDVNMDELQNPVASALVQEDTASEIPVVPVENTDNMVAADSIPLQNSEDTVENAVKQPDYKSFYGVPSNLLRNSLNALPKASAEITDEQKSDVVNTQVPASTLSPVNSENSSPLPTTPEVVEYETTPTPMLDEVPVPLDTSVTENPVSTENIVSDNQIKESMDLVPDQPVNKYVENAEINDKVSEQSNEFNDSSEITYMNAQGNVLNLHDSVLNKPTSDEGKLSNVGNAEQPVQRLENNYLNSQENVFNYLATSEEKLDNTENSEQPLQNLENINSEENGLNNHTSGEEKFENSAENSDQLTQNLDNSDQPVQNLGNYEINSENPLPNSYVNDNENNVQSAGSTENSPEINDLNSEETVTSESVTVNDQVTEKVEIPVQNSDQFEETTEKTGSEEPGIFSKIYSSIFGSSEDTPPNAEIEDIEDNKVIEEPTERRSKDVWNTHAQENPADKYISQIGEQIENTEPEMQSCQSGDNPSACPLQNNNYSEQLNESTLELPDNAYSIFLYLSLTSVTLLLFLLGYYYIEKKRNDGSLVISINELEQKLLISSKECLLLQDDLNTTKERLSSIEDSSFGSNEMVTTLKEEIDEAKNVKLELEDQIANLERELENATEAGMELNRMLREVLSSQTGNEHLMQNIDHLQKQLNEQQVTINTMNSTLGLKTTENELLATELSVAHEKITQLQAELDKMVVNLLSVQEEKCSGENDFEEQTQRLKKDFDTAVKSASVELNVLKDENARLKSAMQETQRTLDVKNNEYALLQEGMKDVQTAQNNKESLKALLDVSKVKAEVQQLREEKHKMSERYQAELEAKLVAEKEVLVMMQEVQIQKDKFDEAEREKVEAQTRLEVLSGYFKEKETQLQKEINENESKWIQKEGEATSTVERIKWIQEELQNYKSQNETLKKEILDQEVSLKSQISMLEKKSHDNWMLARQAERRVEESKQEASQLRNRLTIVEKNLNNASQATDESKMQNRIMSPLESNGEIPVSPLHMTNSDNPGSPPLMFPHRDHMTTSPPLPGLPPFMQPPHGVPFMPPPMSGVPPFMPPPPALYPGDHRPPPLGRMSSPPLHGRYSPDSRAYSPYDRDDSPPLSPTYTDSDYRRRSPPPPPPSSHMPRIYSPYSGGKGRPSHWEEEEREYRGQQHHQQQHRSKPRTHKGTGLSSGSGNSNESLDNSGRHSGRV